MNYQTLSVRGGARDGGAGSRISPLRFTGLMSNVGSNPCSMSASPCSHQAGFHSAADEETHGGLALAGNVPPQPTTTTR
jgi:hypothetical protein